MLGGLLDKNHIQPVSPSCLYSCMCGKYVKITDDGQKTNESKENIHKESWPEPGDGCI